MSICKNIKSLQLETLVKKGTLKSYSYNNVDSNGVEGEESVSRNTEKLTLVFPDGEVLTLDTFCSGCLNDTGFIFNLLELSAPDAKV